MVGEFPDAAAAERVVSEDEIPIFLKISGTVAHRVAIFAEVERLREIGIFNIALKHFARRGVHTALDVDEVTFDAVTKAFVLALHSRGIAARCVLAVDDVVFVP